ASNTRWLSGVAGRSSAAVTRSPRPLVVPSTTAMSFRPPHRIIKLGRKMIAPKNTGPSSAITQNHFRRTRSTNSRRTTARILPTGPLLRVRRRCDRLRPHQVDEDLVERGLGELKAGEPRAGRHEGLEDLLSVRSGGELQLGVLPGAVRLRHQAWVGEDPIGVAASAVEIDEQMPTPVGSLHVRQAPVHEHAATRDAADVAAQLLGLLPEDRRQEDRLATAP